MACNRHCWATAESHTASFPLEVVQLAECEPQPESVLDSGSGAAAVAADSAEPEQLEHCRLEALQPAAAVLAAAAAAGATVVAAATAAAVAAAVATAGGGAAAAAADGERSPHAPEVVPLALVPFCQGSAESSPRGD